MPTFKKHNDQDRVLNQVHERNVTLEIDQHRKPEVSHTTVSELPWTPEDDILQSNTPKSPYRFLLSFFPQQGNFPLCLISFLNWTSKFEKCSSRGRMVSDSIVFIFWCLFFFEKNLSLGDEWKLIQARQSLGESCI